MSYEPVVTHSRSTASQPIIWRHKAVPLPSWDCPSVYSTILGSGSPLGRTFDNKKTNNSYLLQLREPPPIVFRSKGVHAQHAPATAAEPSMYTYVTHSLKILTGFDEILKYHRALTLGWRNKYTYGYVTRRVFFVSFICYNAENQRASSAVEPSPYSCACMRRAIAARTRCHATAYQLTSNSMLLVRTPAASDAIPP